PGCSFLADGERSAAERGARADWLENPPRPRDRSASPATIFIIFSAPASGHGDSEQEVRTQKRVDRPSEANTESGGWTAARLRSLLTAHCSLLLRGAVGVLDHLLRPRILAGAQGLDGLVPQVLAG